MADAALLPAIERSAAASFADVPGLEWIVTDRVMSADQHEAAIGRGTSWVAVDDDDRPLGFLSAEVIGDDLHIGEASVDRARQGSGAGRALFATAIGWARAAGLDAVTLTTFRDLAWNELFYRKLGFVTLDAGAVDTRLAALLAEEAAHGLPPDRRCAMRLLLRP